MSEPSWNDLEKKASPPKEDRFAELCMRVFTAADGRELLAELRRKHFDSPFEPLTASDRALAIRAANQHFVRELEIACERALKANAKPK
jgi:hypothetical protein